MNNDDIINFVLHLEGPPHNTPGDAGGETRWGMTAPMWKTLSEYCVYPTPFEVASYRDIEKAVGDFYFHLLGVERLSNPVSKLIVFDTVYLHGIDKLELVLKRSPVRSRADALGFEGAIRRLVEMSPSATLRLFAMNRLELYKSKIDFDLFHPFAWGWINRLHLVVRKCQAFIRESEAGK